jgi:hypothetical protein
MKPLVSKQMCQHRLVPGPESPYGVGVARALIGHSDGHTHEVKNMVVHI